MSDESELNQECRCQEYGDMFWDSLGVFWTGKCDYCKNTLPMTREEIRHKYTDLMNELAKCNNNTRRISEELRKLNEVCPHQHREFNYEIGCRVCPDCGLRE